MFLESSQASRTLQLPVSLREECGLTHLRQVLCVARPERSGDVLGTRRLGDTEARPVFFQQSHQDPTSGFVEVKLDPFDDLTLEVVPRAVVSRVPSVEESGVAVEWDGGMVACISNEAFSLEVPMGQSQVGPRSGFETCGPVYRMRVGSGPWRGRTFFDLREKVISWRGDLLESGPLRVVYRYRAELGDDRFYAATLTIDRCQPFAVVDEEFEAGTGDQVIWDFAAADLPEDFLLLDSTAAYQTVPLFYHFDQRLSRMLCWTQQSQHFGFSDGYAVRFSSAGKTPAEVAGFIALEGGQWRGGKLNHLEAWARRWFPGDPASRRDVPFEAKADGQPGPESTPGRGRSTCEPHFNVEGWIGRGRRKWALVLATMEQIEPLDAAGEPLGHFENTPDRDRYRLQQSLLRRIHTQHGILPLQTLAGCDLIWEEEPERLSGFRYPHAVIDRHFAGQLPPAEAKREMMDFLAARVCGFWEGSGSAYTNPVVTRPLAPEMFRFEWLSGLGVFTAEERRLVRAQFAFLCHLFASENYYAGNASMLPVESPDALDPTLAGMANQNFYTDVITVYGTAGQVFWRHPSADRWRELFRERWHRQLECHMYPGNGVWEESHTYYHHVLHTILPLLLRRRDDGAGDEFATPALQRLVGGEISQLTPRDAFCGDCRHMVVFGDHGADVERYRYLMREFADAFSPHHPELAGKLAWAYREMKGDEPLRVEPAAPAVRNEYVEGLGVMFRGSSGDGSETLLALRSGAAWGHHHNDDGSIQFYAAGTSMIVDAMFSRPSAGPKKFAASGHSRWTLRDAEPVNHFWRFSRGWVSAMDLDGPLAFATAYSPVFLVRAGADPAMPLRRPALHTRTIVQISPEAYLVADTADPVLDQQVSFHLPGQAAFAGGFCIAKPSGAAARLAIGKLSVPCSAARLEEFPIADQAEREFRTTALVYDIGGVAFSAFLVAVCGEILPEIYTVSPGSWQLRGGNWDVTVARGGIDWTIRDSLSGISRIFPDALR